MSEGDASAARPKLSLFGLIAFAVVVVGVALLLVSTHNTNEAPFTAVEVHPKLAGLEFMHQDGPGVTAYLEGRIVVDRTSAPDATYAVIVIDNRRHRVVPNTYGNDRPQQRGEGNVGWDRAVASLSERYDWNPSATDRAAFFTPGASGSLPFAARLPAEAISVGRLGDDFTVVLALTHGSDHVYWAVKLAYHANPNGSTSQQSQ